jgi:hypothetical protein
MAEIKLKRANKKNTMNVVGQIHGQTRQDRRCKTINVPSQMLGNAPDLTLQMPRRRKKEERREQ